MTQVHSTLAKGTVVPGRVPKAQDWDLVNGYLKRILTARVYDVAIESPLDSMSGLSQRLGNRILLKREDMQPVFSFKLRGGYNKISRLTEEQRARGVIAASAGNHAQGVSLAARRLGLKAVIVMPRTTPDIKVEAVKSFGARAVLHGDNYDEAKEHAYALMEKHGYTMIPPYDDPDVISGQGTVGMEILRQHQDRLDAIFVPVGGGGLIAGIAACVKAVRPEIRIIGVEPQDAASMQAALAANERVVLDQVGLFVDGCSVKQAGAENFRLVQRLVDEVITVDDDAVCAAVADIFRDERALAEPAGALALAGLKQYVAKHELVDQTLVAIHSGANVNFDRLGHITERVHLGERHEALLAVTIPERPGSFRGFIEIIGDRRGITEFNYRYSDPDQAHIFVGMHLGDEGEAERDELVEKLCAGGYSVHDLTHNEMAKVHVRHMVGGRASGVDDEILLRFEFPERPGALFRFLKRIGRRWNISLFHYRNHGAAYGQVLVGMQVPEDERGQCYDKLGQVGYAYVDETHNPAYRFFLAANGGG